MQNIVEYFAFSLFIVLFIIGYIRGGYLEGLRNSSYSAIVLTLLAFSIYFMSNYKQIQQQIWDPITQNIMFDKIPTEIYAYSILFIISAIMAFAVEQYVNRKQKK